MFGRDTQWEQNLRKDVSVLAGLIGERNSRKPSAIEAARAHIKRRLAEHASQVNEQHYPVPTRDAVNLEVRFPGSSRGKLPLIVGAHYDSAPTAPGADDNASAVAALLQIAGHLSSRKLKREVRCVFYDCEEPPHFATSQMGSFQHAERLRDANEKIHGMICLESIGYFPRRVESRVPRPRFIAALDFVLGGRYVAITSDFRSIPFGLPFVLRFMTAGFFKFVPAAMPGSLDINRLSDHRSYWDHGYRALMVTNTAMFRNPNYHEPTDLPETLDYKRLATLTRMLANVICRM